MKHTFTTFLLFLCLFTSANAQSRTPITITDQVVTTSYYSDKEVTLKGKSELHFRLAINPLINSSVDLTSEDSWIIFDNIKPAGVIDSLLKSVLINGKPAVLQTNVRVSIYKQGAVVIPHPSSYQPLQVFDGQNLTGESKKYSMNVFNSDLGAFDNRIRSFKLKRGYMATVAANADGSGFSRVYIADNEDLEINTLTRSLDQVISFIRVFQWEYVSKKGWCGTGDPTGSANKMNGTWFYNWNIDQWSKPNQEYVTIKQLQYWPSWSQITAKNGTHLLGYNEPDHTDQSNLTVDQAIAAWPEYQKTGMRIGSPATTNNSWIFDFMNKAKAKNYRVDFVAIHAYWGGLTPTQWYNNLKTIYETTGRPLWITEWNNGANWTTESWPSAWSDQMTKNKNDITAILQVLDTARFVERYSIYNWVESKRAMILDDGWITPAGNVYAADNAPMAFNRAVEVVPYMWVSYYKPTLNLTIPTDKSSVQLTWTDDNGEYAKGFVIERKINTGDYTEVIRIKDGAARAYSDQYNFTSSGKVTYRIRTIMNIGIESENSNEMSFDVTAGKDIQYGKFLCGSLDWSSVIFGQEYTSSLPVIVLGGATNNNASALFSPRTKVIDGKSFSLQLTPWSYLALTALAKTEYVPYLALPEGEFSFGTIKAKAVSKNLLVNGTWRTVSFATPFDSIPVVFVGLQTCKSTYATTLRVRNVTKTGFDIKLQKESAITSILPIEYFSYVAMTPGSGDIEGQKVFVGRTTDNAVGTSLSQYAKISFAEELTDPIFISQMQTCNDDTVTATLRYRALGSLEANVFKQREKSLGFTAAAKETAGWIAINQAVLSLNSTLKEKALAVYPNPVQDKLFFNRKFETATSVQIFNSFGKLVIQTTIDGNQLNVNRLPKGCYFVKTSSGDNLKFLKK